MKYIRRTFIEFIYPGAFFSERSVREIKTRDLSKVQMPKNAFGFVFYDILSMVVEADGKQIQLTSQQINVSPTHYYGGKVYTVAELKRQFPNEDILIGNIEGNGHRKAIKCRTGNWQPFKDEDVFIEVA